jgi:PAS domain S-box-containing protein
MSIKDIVTHIETTIANKDVDEVRRLTTQLDQAMKQCSAFLHQHAIAEIVFHPRTAQVLDANEQAHHLTGYDAAALKALSMQNLHPQSTWDGLWENYQTLPFHESSTFRNIPFRTKEGSQVYANITASYIDHQQEKAIRLSIEAIPAAVNLREAELEQTNRELQKALKTRLDFLAMVSHGLRTPLNTIMGYNSLLTEGVYGSLNEKQAKALNSIDRNASRLLVLMNQLLDISRLETGRVVLYPEPVDIGDAVNTVMESFKESAEKKGLLLELKQPPVRISVTTDRDRFLEILHQLISNAIKFTDEGSVSVEIAAEKEQAVISIRDSGPGIDSHKQDELFDLFQEGELFVSPQQQGVGLGLAIVKRLVDLLGMDISLTSEIGRGCTFALSILSGVKIHSKMLTKEQLLEPLRKEMSFSTKEGLKTVLIVDDDPYTVEMLSEYLEYRGGYRVIKAYSGLHAMIYLAQTKPDLLLIDLLMPTIHGNRIIQYCRDLWGDSIKIVVITSHNMGKAEQQKLESNVSFVLDKNDLTNQHLIKKLDAILETETTLK